ncbi:hypothetical protein LPJ75_003803, partial [Coemansia sp. RSA 2598]
RLIGGTPLEIIGPVSPLPDEEAVGKGPAVLSEGGPDMAGSETLVVGEESPEVPAAPLIVLPMAISVVSGMLIIPLLIVNSPPIELDSSMPMLMLMRKPLDELDKAEDDSSPHSPPNDEEV